MGHKRIAAHVDGPPRTRAVHFSKRTRAGPAGWDQPRATKGDSGFHSSNLPAGEANSARASRMRCGSCSTPTTRSSLSAQHRLQEAELSAPRLGSGSPARARARAHLRARRCRHDNKVAAAGRTVEGEGRQVRCDNTAVYVELIDARTLSAPLNWFPRLLHASPDHCRRCALSDQGRELSWGLECACR
jgi:hypothetical protein